MVRLIGNELIEKLEVGILFIIMTLVGTVRAILVNE
jgi:hypothetical protein